MKVPHFGAKVVHFQRAQLVPRCEGVAVCKKAGSSGCAVGGFGATGGAFVLVSLVVSGRKARGNKKAAPLRKGGAPRVGVDQPGAIRGWG